MHQLVLHPAVSASLKVGATNVGRDKLYRAIQYVARFLAWCESSPLSAGVVSSRARLAADTLLSSPPQPFPIEVLPDALHKGYSNETVAKLTALKSQLALSRKRERHLPPLVIVALAWVRPSGAGFRLSRSPQPERQWRSSQPTAAPFTPLPP